MHSVLLRAKLIGGMPEELIGALTGLVEGHFPVAAPAKYADDAVLKLAKTARQEGQRRGHDRVRPDTTGIEIYAKQDSPVIAVNDGKVVKVGENKQLGQLRRAPGRDRQHLHVREPGLDPVSCTRCPSRSR